MRLAEPLAGLSRFADLGFGLHPGESLRSCALACGLARALDLPDRDVRAAFYTALLHHVGCTGYAHETAVLFGDELRANAAAARTDVASPRDVLSTFVPTLTEGQPLGARARLTLTALRRGRTWGEAFTTAACEVGRDAARRLDLPEEVQRGIFHVYELWMGGGAPSGLAGDDIPVGSRVARLTGVAALFDRIGGVRAAVRAVRQRSGGMLDPSMVERFVDRADELLGKVNAGDPRSLILEAEPQPVVAAPAGSPVAVAVVFADLVDLKSPHFHGHSRGVAHLARGAGEHLRLSPDCVDDLELAGLLHDVGRVAISASVWERPDQLSGDDWEQVRLHPYHSERILLGSEQLARLAPLVGRHHERLDGSGYHRGSRADDLPMSARVLAVADTYQTMTEDRPHRSAYSRENVERRLLEDARRGLLDPDAVSGVLGTAGHQHTAGRRRPPAGLSDREVEVLGLVAAGRSNAEIAKDLVISRRTAEHHVQHVYTKIGVSSRAAATLFAIQHQLLAGPDR